MMIYRILFLLTGILVSLLSYSQNGKTTLSQNSILIGENITLTYTIHIPQDAKVLFIPQQSHIPSHRKAKNGSLTNEISSEIEILNTFFDTIIKGKKSNVWIGKYEITAWDSGTFVLSSTNIIIDDSTFVFPSIELVSALVKGKQGQDLYDIKESFSEIPDEPFSITFFIKRNWWWLLAILLAAIGFLIYKIIKKQNAPVEQYKVLSLKERTLLAIDSLEKERLWEKQQLKEHFIELSFILRSYLSSRYEINLLEKTTKETKLLLQQIGLHEETIAVIVRILIESDMVKFAKSNPDEMAILKISQLARQVIAETSPIEFENA